ncbi:Kynurenine formamidase [Rubrobacter xylanophilus DSM 9941]|uniref:cyclase family protein n=1 Tax=Rubrobacter xylanophilus TaxID=49319 RepID=UPI001C63E0C0|nr:cyclase family protein [Rubrobacter xylanophilus]QYJ16612.1 Kynurenine formamidase [Rubrobacter xylanophilus DSM 9941]
MKIVDLSPAVPHGFKGPPSTNLGVQLNVRTKNGTGYWQSTQLDLMSLHTGTHVESALHTVEDGEPIDQVALERVIGEAVVLDLTPVEPMQILDVPDLERANEGLEAAGESIRPGDILLLRTDWAQRHIGTPEYFRESPGLTEAAARWVVERAPKAVGCDFFEEPAAREPGWEAHEFVVHGAILGAGIPLIEGLVNLRELPSRVSFFAPFYKFAGVESAPARAFALLED